MAHVFGTYRGKPEPRPAGNKRNPHSYVINDGDYGYYTGSESSVLEQWQRAVDADLLDHALSNSYSRWIVALDNPLLCETCGAMVGDVDKHNGWHRSLDEMGIQDFP